MAILVLTGYDANMQELGDICLPSKKAYAERHGYDFECVRKYPTDVHPSWHKLQLLRERISKYDAILWLDADTIVTEPVIECPMLGYILTASADWCSDTDGANEMPSMGNFVLRNIDGVHLWLDSASSIGRFRNRPMWEQDAVHQCMREDAWFRAQVGVLSRRKMNSVHTTCTPHGKPPGAPWKKGDFLIHLTGVKERIILAKYFAAWALKNA